MSNIGGVGKFIGSIFGGGAKSTTTTIAAQPTAQAAAPVATNTTQAETGDVSATAALKKRAKGKSSLTITAGSSSGGTGLNV